MKHLKNNLLMVALMLCVNLANAQLLSDSAKISLITCNPGLELYSVFGHSAIRVNDPEKGIDWVYNYGTFSFEQPGFYVKFVRGYLNYQLSVYHTSDLMNEYVSENRSVYEQVLNLNQQQKEKIFQYIEFNRLPENKYYLYDFFFDNCATRIRDVFQKELNDQIDFQAQFYETKTFREMLKQYLEPHPWARFGINLVLGSVADRKASLYESMFLPDYMKKAFGNARNLSGQAKTKLAGEEITLFEQKVVESEVPLYSKPGFALTGLMLLIFLGFYFELRNRTYYKCIDFFVFLFFGILGSLLFFLWFLTDHTAVVKNWNLLWAFPTHLIMAFFVFRKSKLPFLKYYFAVSGFCAFVVLPLWAVLPQRFDLAIIPLVVIVSLRSYQMYRYHR
jgi:hypothetical protein